jgi:5-methylcytosine-specific restriction protein A
MPNKFICKAAGCNALVDKRGTYCQLHSYKQREDDERKLQWLSGQSNKYRKEWADQYNCARWKNERKKFLEENPRCNRCGDEATVVDHIIEHRGNEELFWEQSNWQSLCSDCHKMKTIREMAAHRR